MFKGKKILDNFLRTILEFFVRQYSCEEANEIVKNLKRLNDSFKKTTKSQNDKRNELPEL